MTFIRRALATGALAAALTGSALAPATADTTDTTCDTASLQAAITEARATEVAARKAFVASNRPIGKLIATERKDAVAAKREALAELKALAKESRTLARAGKPAKAERADKPAKGHDKPAAPVETSKKSDKGAAAAAIKAEIRAYQDQLREANKLLGSKKALVEQVKAERREAKVSWDAAKGDLRELRQQLEACEESAPVEEPVVEEPVTDPVDTEPVVEEPVVTEPVVEEPVTDAPVTEPTV